MKPFLKWAGGKRWLARRFPVLFEHTYNRFVEPFLGSGAVFFYLAPQRSVLSDLNPALINLYCCLRNDHKLVIKHLRKHAHRHSDSYYYEMRTKQFKSEFAKAAQFLYLNRTCWNGLYRENLRGEFNVPRGTKNTVIFEDDDFGSVAASLAHAKLLTCDFEEILSQTAAGDFVFVDPPYTVRHNVNGFVKYNESIFSWADQLRLASVLRNRSNVGATFLMTNAFHPSVLRLYEDFAWIIPISRASVLAGSSQFRGSTQEALILMGAAWKQKARVLSSELGLSAATASMYGLQTSC